VKVCAAINPHLISREAGQRWYREEHTDINWFRRGRVCSGCGLEFLTAELNEVFVEELVELRNAISELKKNAEAYVAESKAAAKSLEKLNVSLSVLRALRVYKDA
jgi:hypothetical protein